VRDLLADAKTVKAEGRKYAPFASATSTCNRHRDHVSTGTCHRYDIKIGDRGHHIPDLSTRPITSHRDVVELMALGLSNRAVGCTNVNEVSSRSHCVLTLYVEGLNTTTGLASFGKLHLVDLAGSERLKVSTYSGGKPRPARHG
jgi:kinesin family protein C2/C3